MAGEKPSEDIAARAAVLVAQDRAGCVKGHINLSAIKERVLLLSGGAPYQEDYLRADAATLEVRRIWEVLLAFADHLDSEAERRAAWEAKVEAFARAQGVEL